MPRKTKSPTERTETPETLAGDANGSAVKPPRRPAAKTKKTAAKKATKRRSSRKTAGTASTTAHPTEEEIQIRAYFIAERRHRLALPGDAGSDWLEAKRQLLLEAAPR